MRIFLIGIVTIFCQALTAQYSLSGTVLDANTSSPLEFATVVVMNSNDGTHVTGTTTDLEGNFNFELTQAEVYIEISFMGFKTKTIRDITFEQGKANVGNVTISENSLELEEVVLTAERSTTEFKLDKRVFNVGSDLSSTGASALEVLNNVPSVNVSIEGDISLRGAGGVQILINGKPTVLADESSNALGTITADMMEKVEVITNPSAKYEAEGSAGIINIVLKKNEKKGVNGSVSLNTGVPHNHSLGFSLNNRTNKFNLFTQLGVGYRELPTDTENENIDLISGTSVLSTGEEFRNENFYNIILGSDYYIDERNVITLSGSFTYEVEDQPSQTNFILFENEETIDEWERSESTSAANPKLQYELQYKRDFEDNKDHQLLFSAIGNYFGKEQSSEFFNSDVNNTFSLPNQETETHFNEGKYTFSLDYTKPYSDNWTLETGAHYLRNNVSNDFEVRNENEDGAFLVDPGLTNIFEYNQNVLGVYTTGAYEGNIWGIKLGLRVENTELNTLLINTDERNDQNFTNLFPSLHSSYKLSERVSFQLGYSRRIFRPRLWDLNPFFNIRNNFNIRQGNPDLLPEFTDSYEIGAIFIYEDISFNTTVYHRYTTDKIERIFEFDDGVTITVPQNIGTSNATGFEFNFKYSPIRKLVFNGDFNYNVFVRNGQFNDQVFDFSASVWRSKLITKWKVSQSIDFEWTTRYESSEQTIQGVVADNLYADLGIKYKLGDGKAVFNLGVRDVFASRIRQTTIDQVDYFTFTSRQRGRFITLGFSYGFGKGEAMQYSGRRR